MRDKGLIPFSGGKKNNPFTSSVIKVRARSAWNALEQRGVLGVTFCPGRLHGNTKYNKHMTEEQESAIFKFMKDHGMPLVEGFIYAAINNGEDELKLFYYNPARFPEKRPFMCLNAPIIENRLNNWPRTGESFSLTEESFGRMMIAIDCVFNNSSEELTDLFQEALEFRPLK